MRLHLLILISTATALSISQVEAQVESALGFFNEALLFSQTTYGGSARIQGIGGAQIALGGDISNIMTNPAGLGFFNKSEVSFTPAVNIYNSKTSYFEMESFDNNTRANFNNLGFVYDLSKSDISASKWKGGAIGLSFNRINNFHQQFTYSVENFDNSIIDFFIEDSEGIAPTDLGGLTEAAYVHYVINPFNNDPYQYDSFITGFPIQDETVTTKGSQYQLTLSAGGNLEDRFYFGGGIGLNTLNYEYESTFRESDYFDPEFPDDPVILNEMILREELKLDGIGFTGTFGLIYRLNDMVRLGASVITPTWYQINDESTFDFFTDYNNFYFQPDDIVLTQDTTFGDLLVADYDLKTPLRINAGAAFFLGKKGFVSADVEFLDYGSSSLSSNGIPPVEGDNAAIKNLYTSVTNLRIGGEYRVQPFLLRLGYSLQGDPYRIQEIDRSRNAITGGAGWRKKNVFVDLAITHGWWNSLHIPYSTSNSPAPVIGVLNQNTNLALTAGFRF